RRRIRLPRHDLYYLSAGSIKPYAPRLRWFRSGGGGCRWHPPRPDGAALQRALPFLQLPLGGVLLDAVALLDAPEQLFAFAIHIGQVVIGELRPLLLRLALHLLPIAGHGVPVHLVLPFLMDSRVLGKRQPGTFVPIFAEGRAGNIMRNAVFAH